MSKIEFTQELCEQLHAMPKYVASRISWKTGNGHDVLIFQAQVLANDGTIGFELSGYWKKHGRFNRTRWGFSLRFLGHCVRRFCMATYHKNPGEPGKVKGSHKHRFSSSKIDDYAYKPNPPISEVDANQSLMDFLAEANITMPAGHYQNYMFP